MATTKPRRKLAAEPTQPHEAQIAPWPSIDKYPTVVGSSLTLTYISAVFRMATTGYRREYVDCLDELLERDSHAYCCYSTRILTVAGSRITCDAPPCDDSEKELADQMAREFSSDFFAINNLRQSIASLLWAVYYGVQASEVSWERTDRYRPKDLHWIHSRRIAYPNPMSWDPYIWDLGAINSWGFLDAAGGTSSGFGITPRDFPPGKFIFHAPQYRGDYPSRDGIGRETAIMSALKLMGLRGASQYIERFAKPWVWASFTTAADGKPRIAAKEDIQQAENVVKGLGSGTSASAVIPDSIMLHLEGPGAQASGSGKLAHSEFIALCNAEISKAVLMNSDSVEAGPNGSRASTSERMKGQRAAYKYDAACIGDTLSRDMSLPWARLNYPGKEHLRPLVVFHIEEEMTPAEIIAIAKDGAGIGIPVDADKTAAKVGLDVVAKDADDGRICRPLAPVKDLAQLNYPPPEPEPPEGQLPTADAKPTDNNAPKTVKPADDVGDDEDLTK